MTSSSVKPDSSYSDTALGAWQPLLNGFEEQTRGRKGVRGRDDDGRRDRCVSCGRMMKNENDCRISQSLSLSVDIIS